MDASDIAFSPGAAFLAQFKEPIPVTRTLKCTINLESFEETFREIYFTIIKSSKNPQQVVDELCAEDFIIVCMYYLRYRLDLVSYSVFAEKSPHCIDSLPRHGSILEEVPLSIAVILNSVGHFSCLQNSLTLAPVAPDRPVDPADFPKIFEAYYHFIFHLKNRQIPMGKLSSSPAGSPYWALNLSEPCGKPSTLSGDSILVYAPFADWTARDALLAVLVHNPQHNNGPDYSKSRFESPIIRNVQQMRQVFFLHGSL